MDGPSWPELPPPVSGPSPAQYPISGTPPGYPPPVYPPPAYPPGYPGAAPYPYGGRLRPKASGSVALTIVGVVLIAACLLVLPWAEFNSEYFLLPELTDNANDANGSSFGSSYVAGWCYPMAFFASLYAFGASLDSKAWRWVHFGFGAVIVLLLLAGMGTYLLGSTGTRNQNSAAVTIIVFVVITVIYVAAHLGLALLRGVGVRVVGGLLMLLYGTLHTAALIDLIDDGADLLPFAFVATIGYLLCAVGAFIGPKYVPAPR
jgi:hypothetical protein